MYAHRPERLRVDCVDLDPYGTAAPFIDAAVQCVNEGGQVSYLFPSVLLEKSLILVITYQVYFV